MDFKYQYSQSNGKGGILVARSNDKEEIELDKVWVDSQMEKIEAVKPVPVLVSTHFCEKHQTAMKERAYQGRTWYDHRRKNGEEWEKCSGGGFPSELRQSIDDSFNKDY